MSRYDFQIPVTFKHRIVFTRDAFSTENPALAEILNEGGGRRAMVFVEENVATVWPDLVDEVQQYFAELDLDYLGTTVFPGGEAAKADDHLVREVWAAIDAAHLDRHSYALVIGGGAFLDAVGYAAATAHRGVRLVRFPTTTLSQDDSGVGVKCAINEFGKKNWVGSFSVPYAVINDFRYLHSQDEETRRGGLIEAIKVALVRDAEFFHWIEANLQELAALEPTALEACVEKSALLHARHIAAGGDPFETGSSRPLDFGHWAAHKLEAMTHYQLSHAPAVAVGLALDTLYSARSGLLKFSVAEQVLRVLDGLQLSIYHPALDWLDDNDRRRVFDGLDEFREHLGGELTVLLLEDVGRGVDVHQIDEVLLGECMNELRTRWESRVEGHFIALAFTGKFRLVSGMRLRSITQLLIFSALTVSLPAAVSLPSDGSAALPAVAEGPAKEAMEAFQAGRHAKAVELAKPLAEQGNSEALYLMGFAHESGKGAELSKDKALEYYRKATALKHKDATYRLAFILLASEKEEERNQAREALESAAKDDPTVAARILGEAYLRGRLTPTADPDKAIFWWKSAADAGDIPSVLLTARFYEGQFGFPELKNPKESLAAYGKAAGLGDAGAMAALGSRLLSGDEKSRDEKKGREWLKKAIAAKEYSAYLALGDYEENIKKDLKAALAEYERGKDVGQIDCTLRTADFYIQGKGVEKDVSRGMALLEKAAEAGNPAANFRLAVESLSTEKPDLLVGYKHLLSAANGNLVEAQNELGLLYLSGKLAVADGAAGVAWLTRAAQGGYAQAQNNLATLYERGAAGVTQNMENAGQLYLLAANQGHGPATLALARLLNEGIGTKADPVKAWALATLAQERGEEDAKKMIDAISAQFDDKQKIEAQKQLEEMKSGKATDAKPAAAPKPAPAPAPAPKKK